MAKVKRLTIDQACVAYDEGRLASAYQAFMALAEEGDETACFMLGYVYDTGRGARRSKNKAIQWYLRAYDARGSSAAMAASNLATIYRDAGDAREEYQWYGRAAAQGDDDAHVELGIRLLAGKGVKRNPRLAVAHFKAALRSKDITDASRDTAQQLLMSCRGWK